MTLSQIIAQALFQLDEDAEDVSEYEERFRVYANMGYDIAVREYLKPRRIFYTEVDEEGNAPVPGLTVVRVIELRDENGFDVGFDLDPCGRCFHVWRDDLRGQTLRAVCEVAFYPAGRRTGRTAAAGIRACGAGGLHLLSAPVQRQSGQAEPGAVLSDQLLPDDAADSAGRHGERDEVQEPV